MHTLVAQFLVILAIPASILVPVGFCCVLSERRIVRRFREGVPKFVFTKRTVLLLFGLAVACTWLMLGA